jgi:hypothetical protein
MRPTVIALTGLPGTGKSKLGSLVFRGLPLGFAYLDIDTLTRPLVCAALELRGLDAAGAAASGELRKLRDAQYACLWDQVREQVALDGSVLYVAPMTHELDDPSAFLRIVESFRPARFVLIRVHSRPEVVHLRLQQRREFQDDLRLARWDIDRHRYDHPVSLPMPGLELDSSDRPCEALAEHALRWLRLQLAWSERRYALEAYAEAAEGPHA